MKKAHSKRRRNAKLFAGMSRGEERDERINRAEKEDRRKQVFLWPMKKKRRWCAKHGG